MASCSEAALFFVAGWALILWRLGRASNTENGEKIKQAAADGIVRMLTRWFK